MKKYVFRPALLLLAMFSFIIANCANILTQSTYPVSISSASEAEESISGKDKE